ncbi:MAG: DUF3466 family protein [Gammaproteobacteria bacterium]|nr:DUF3466 family protein [Gammaproteobacteria bacterium]
MTRKNQLLSVFAIGLIAGPISAYSQGAYDYESINYPGSAFDQAFGINNRGDVVGNGSIDPDTIPYVWDSKKGGFTNVTPVAGYVETAVLGISDKGDLAGSVFDGSVESGLIVDKNGAVTVFDHPDAVVFTQARGINNKGLVTGFRDDPNDQGGLENGFIYDSKEGTFTDIVPSLFTIAQGINSRGDVVGSAIFDDGLGVVDPCNTGIPFVRLGWRRSADGTVTYFSVNGEATRARGITDSGTIAGWVDDPGSGLIKGFVVELDGTQCQTIPVPDEDLLHFPGATATFVGGIKNSGEVVGSYDDGTTTLGFIARPQ